jgi:FlgN protein
VTGFAEVSDILWRERELLDVLLFKLDSERLLLRAGSIRWLARSTHEVDLVLEQLQLVEISRALEVDDLAAQLGLRPGATLAELAAVAPALWAELFDAHRAAFRTLIAEVSDLAESNQRTLREACATSAQNVGALAASARKTHVPA